MRLFRFFVIAITAASLACAAGASTNGPVAGTGTAPGLGRVNFATTCGAEAHTRFSIGLALLHHMMYDESRKAFADAAAKESQCAMANWGLAMSMITPLWPSRPTAEQMRTGREALATALGSPTASEHEKDYVTSLQRFYEGEERDYTQRLGDLEAAMAELASKYADDTDATAFYALMHLGTAPKTDTTFAHQRRAIELLSPLYEKEPEHPGLMHYLIHAYDNTALAKDGVEVARSYDKIAPDVPHALHMPSHVFVRLGMWDDVATWNHRSAKSAKAHPIDGKTSFHHAHAVDYIVYAYLQQGKNEQAKAARDELMAVQDYVLNFAAAFALAASPARYALERGAWKEAAELTHATTFPMEKFPGAEAVTIFARGMGFVRLGDLAKAKAEIENLGALLPRLSEPGDAYWKSRVEIQRNALSAWVMFAEGQKDEAIETLQAAAKVEDNTDKHPVTPGHVLPARQALADMLMQAGKTKEALAAYEECLKHAPGRLACVSGAGQAADKVGDKRRAKEMFEQLVELAAPEAAQRADVQRAKARLREM